LHGQHHPGARPGLIDGGSQDGQYLRIDLRALGDPGGDWGAGAHSGMFPCLRLGRSSRFDTSRARLLTSTRRVSAGSITSSTYPRSAAAYGLAYLSVYSSTNS